MGGLTQIRQKQPVEPSINAHCGVYNHSVTKSQYTQRLGCAWNRTTYQLSGNRIIENITLYSDALPVHLLTPCKSTVYMCTDLTSSENLLLREKQK